MSDESPKWGSPTGHPIASHETDLAPRYNSNAAVTQRSIVVGILSEAIEVIQKCADSNPYAYDLAHKFLKKHGYR